MLPVNSSLTTLQDGLTIVSGFMIKEYISARKRQKISRKTSPELIQEQFGSTDTLVDHELSQRNCKSRYIRIGLGKLHLKFV